MIHRTKLLSSLSATLFVFALIFSGNIAEAAKTRLAFSGGPDGGTFIPWPTVPPKPLPSGVKWFNSETAVCVFHILSCWKN